MSDNNTGFVAGTLVHTDQGLVPIDQLKVGDMVLSKPESGDGKAVYKSVSKIMVHLDQFIWAMRIGGLFTGDTDDDYDYQIEEFLFLGAYQLIWTAEKDISQIKNTMHFIVDTTKDRWTTVYECESGNALKCADEQFADIVECLRLYDTTEPEKVFYMFFPDYDAGIFLDVNAYKNNILTVPDYICDKSFEVVNWDKNEEPIPDEYIATTYSLEVEDNNTYFVGKLGIRVKS